MNLRNRIGQWWSKRKTDKAVRTVAGAGEPALRSLSEMLVRKQQATSALNSTWEILSGSTKFADAGTAWGSMNDSDREKAFRNYAMIRACVGLIVGSYRKAPLAVGTTDVDGGFVPSEEGRNHPALKLLRRPNPEMTQSDLTSHDVSRLQLTGKSFVWKWRNSLGEVTELWPIPTSWVKVKGLQGIDTDPASGDNRRTISHFVISIPSAGGHKDYPVPVTDMIYRRIVDPHTLTGASSPFASAFHPHRLDEEREEYFIELLENMYVPGPVLTQEEEPSEPQMRELKAALQDKIGPGKRFSPLFLWGSGAGIDMVTPLADLDWPGLAAMNESRICAAFGCPPLLVHARVSQENSPLSVPNMRAASRVFYENTMLPFWTWSAEAWTKGLIWDEGGSPDEHIQHDTSGVADLQEDQEKVAASVEKAVKVGAMTLADAQRRLGVEPDPDLEGVYLLPMTLAPWKPGKETAPGVGEASPEQGSASASPSPSPEPVHGEEVEEEAEL